MNATGPHWWEVNLSLCNGLVPSGSKPSPEPMLSRPNGLARLKCASGSCTLVVNTLRPRQNGRHFADDIFKYIFLNENIWILIKISLKFVPKGPINNIPALVQIMAWRRPGDKPLSEAMVVSLLTHICITRPQWVKKPYCHKAKSGLV